MDIQKNQKYICKWFNLFKHRKECKIKCVYCKYKDQYNDKPIYEANIDECGYWLNSASYQIIIYPKNLPKEIIIKELYTQEDNNFGSNKYCFNPELNKYFEEKENKELLTMYKKMFGPTKN